MVTSAALVRSRVHCALRNAMCRSLIKRRWWLQRTSFYIYIWALGTKLQPSDYTEVIKGVVLFVDREP